MNINIPKMGYFILYKSKGGFWDRKIRKAQLKAGIKPEWACYTHIEVSGGGRHSINVKPPYSRLIDITKTHKGRHICILKYDVEDYDYKRYKVAYFSASLNNKPYDIRGALRFIFKWVGQNSKYQFCSEGALWALKMVYPRVTMLLPHKAMPAHFFGIRQMVKHWEGIIC